MEADNMDYPIIRMRGLPFKATVDDIREFFTGIDLPESGVTIVHGPDGRSTGEAFASFDTVEQAQDAMKRHNEKMGTRYIELFRSSPTELSSYDSGQGGAKATRVQENLRMQMEEAGVEESFVRMRGLPFSATEEDVVQFFQGLDITSNGVNILYNYQDKPTGECLVRFSTPQEVELAMERDKQTIGSRYIELFRCSQMDIMNACVGGRGRGRGGGGMMGGPVNMGFMGVGAPPGWGGYGMMGRGDARMAPMHDTRAGYAGMSIPYSMPHVGMGDMGEGASHGHSYPHTYTAHTAAHTHGYGSVMDSTHYGGHEDIGTASWDDAYSAGHQLYTLRMRGLPFRISVHELEEFFAGYDFIPGSIRLGMQQMTGRPNGEAFVSFQSLQAAQKAMQQKNRQHIGSRYVELFFV
eukprot:CAMPEP_0177634854 /NCGR_PEP_ID=MMETSP0447-20121125/3585_1 /TAXON_ID=0 /ORGANISM="Stygamoeba regulata, Strain BSH-02190019" /LENGTH=408 /DNA_ID=CAMNT_0019136593 /DNA_START=30 /DNA_END=1257 /DNA_ORIENTATION=+